MAVLAETNKSNTFTYDENTKMKLLLKTLDDALDDVEQGRVQTLEEAWVEIDAVGRRIMEHYRVMIAQSGRKGQNHGPFSLESLSRLCFRHQHFHIRQNERRHALGLILYYGFSHIIIKSAFPHLLISKTCHQADAA